MSRSPRRQQWRKLSTVERMILDTCGRSALVAWWSWHRDRYNVRRRAERATRRAQIAAILAADPSTGTKELAAVLGVSRRTIRRDRQALRTKPNQPEKVV